MIVDWEAAWHDLASEMVDRQGIGRDSLFALMKRLETEHRLEESVPERSLRLFGMQLSEDLRGLAQDNREERPAADAGAEPRRRTARGPRPSEPHHGGSSNGRADPHAHRVA